MQNVYSMSLITGEQLRQIAKTLTPQRAEQMAGLINEICPKYGIDRVGRLHEFLAQVLHESGEFSAKTENMNYTAARICAVWPSRFKTVAAAAPFARNPVALANEVYGGRMGNNRQGEGWRYRGGGFIGLTGKSVYTEYAGYIGKPVGEAADLVRSTDRYALDSACWFFAIRKKLLDEADADLQDKITYHVNGGYIGKKSRDEYYEAAKRVLK